MGTTYVAQIKVLSVDYGNANGVIAMGTVEIGGVEPKYKTAWIAHPGNKFVRLSESPDTNLIRIPEIKKKIKDAILGVIGQVNLPLTKRIPIE